MINEWLRTVKGIVGFDSVVREVDGNWMLSFVINRIISKIRKRFPGLSRQDILVMIAQVILNKASTNDRKWVAGCRIEGDSNGNLQSHLDKLRSKGGDYYPEEDWLR